MTKPTKAAPTRREEALRTAFKAVEAQPIPETLARHVEGLASRSKRSRQ